MDRIPSEIFIVITSFLPQNDKLTCIRVCRKWFELITESNLYPLPEFHKIGRFHEAISLMNSKKYIGKHVYKLAMKDLDLYQQSILSFLNCFQTSHI
jgi:hypothetical protein